MAEATGTMLLAGAAERDISPAGPVQLFGYPHAVRLSRGIHDPLLAVALYLSCAGRAVVLVTLDLLLLEIAEAKGLRREVAAATGTPESSVLVGCTHTHSGPVSGRIFAWKDDPAAPAPDEAYLAAVRAKTVAAARQARERAVPAVIAWTSTEVANVGGNRGDPGGPVDPECGLLSVKEKASGAWLAAALIFSMHPTVLHEDSTLVSADFPHYARVHLRERLGAGLPLLYFSGPCGNLSPRWFVQAQSFAEAERLGRTLGEAAFRRLSALDAHAFTGSPGLDAAQREVALPRRALPTVEEAERDLRLRQSAFESLRAARAQRARVRTAECSLFGAQSALALARLQASGELETLLSAYRTVVVQGGRLHDTVLLGLPGELFVEYGLQLKRRAPIRLFPASLVNGDLQGYLCTPQAAETGGYEAANSLFAPLAGDILVRTGLEVAAALARPPA